MKFPIDIAGCNETGDFAQVMHIDITILKSRKKMRKLIKEQTKHKLEKNVGATVHHLDDNGDGFVAEAFFNFDDISLSVIIHESVHMAIVCAHKHFGGYLVMSDHDTGARVEETIAYLTDDISSYIIGKLQKEGVKLKAWK